MAKAKVKSKTVVALPKGYKPITGIGQAWDFRTEPMLEGKLLAVREFESKFKQNGKKVMQHSATIQRKDGSEVTVFESAGTRPLFEQKKGARVCIVFRGFRKIKGRTQPMKDFQVGVA